MKHGCSTRLFCIVIVIGSSDIKHLYLSYPGQRVSSDQEVGPRRDVRSAGALVKFQGYPRLLCLDVLRRGSCGYSWAALDLPAGGSRAA